MKEHWIVLVNKILVGLGIFLAVSKFLDVNRLQLTMQYLGFYLTFTEYFIQALLLFSSVIVEYGLLKRKKWAWEGVFVVYGVYFLDRIAGYFFGFFMFDKSMELASVLKYGEVRAGLLSIESYAVIGMIMLLVQAIIGYYIIRNHYRAKAYYKV